MSTPKKVKKKTKKTVKTVKHPSPRAVNIIKDLISIQGEHGNWNYSKYTYGVYNGLVCALRCIDSTATIKYKYAPDTYLESATQECPCGGFIENENGIHDCSCNLNDTETNKPICEYDVITAHTLARILLAGKDLPVYRYPAHDDNYEAGMLIPLSDVSSLIPVDESGEEFLDEVIMIDTLVKLQKPKTQSKNKHLLT